MDLVSDSDAFAGKDVFRLHHVGIVVSSLSEGLRRWALPGMEVDTPVFHDPTQGVRVQFIRPGAEVQIELIEPAGEKSPVLRFLQQHGPGLHHLCYEVDDIQASCETLRQRGALITCAPVPAVAFEGRRIAFLYSQGSLIELVEAPGK
jgi:methylmalonyl-CoA/ethylmalonyl-CoA epimerase